MTKSVKETKQTKRTQVKELPKAEKELSKDEQKKVKGGDWLMQPAGNARPGTK